MPEMWMPTHPPKAFILLVNCSWNPHYNHASLWFTEHPNSSLFINSLPASLHFFVQHIFLVQSVLLSCRHLLLFGYPILFFETHNLKHFNHTRELSKLPMPGPHGRSTESVSARGGGCPYFCQSSQVVVTSSQGWEPLSRWTQLSASLCLHLSCWACLKETTTEPTGFLLNSWSQTLEGSHYCLAIWPHYSVSILSPCEMTILYFFSLESSLLPPLPTAHLTGDFPSLTWHASLEKWKPSDGYSLIHYSPSMCRVWSL